MAFASSMMSEDRKSVEIVLLYKVKRSELNVRIRVISLLSVVGNIYMGILVKRIHRVTEDLIDDEQGDLKSG